MKPTPIIPLIAIPFLVVSLTAAVFEVQNTLDTGTGSLRQAILDANNAPGADEIHFNIAGAGPHTIRPATALPTITDPVVVDGFTQPGSSPNTLAGGINAVLRVELDGSLLSTRGSGLALETSNSTVRGLAINRFPEYGIVIGKLLVFGNDTNIVEGNFVGTDITGTAALPNGVGVRLVFTGGRLGGTAPAARNLVSGNEFEGVSFYNFGPPGVLQGNFIGTDVTGKVPLGNEVGVKVESGGGFLIGGVEPGAANVISGNQSGVLLLMSNIRSGQIKGNAIGTDLSGTVNLGNKGNGIGIVAASGIVIGDDGPNLIAFNGQYGVSIGLGDAVNNAVVANRVYGNVRGGISNSGSPGSDRDPCDADIGLQNSPQLTSASRAGNELTIVGSLNSTAQQKFRLDFYATTVCSTNGMGQGEFHVGVNEVTTAANCVGDFTVVLPVPAGFPAGRTLYVTSTATDPKGNTSPFGPCVAATTPVPPGDRDGDGLPTDWEEANGLNADDPTGSNGPDGDPDGDGFANLAEWKAGTRPNNAASVLRIIDVTPEGVNLRIIWSTAGGRTNQLQAATAGPDGGFTGQFTDLGPAVVVPGAGDVNTNALDTGALTGAKARYYRIRLAP